jgi:hypothetical protein
MFLECQKEKAVLRSLIEGGRQADDTFNWRCEENGAPCLTKDGVKLTLGSLNSLTFDPRVLKCGGR